MATLEAYKRKALFAYTELPQQGKTHISANFASFFIQAAQQPFGTHFVATYVDRLSPFVSTWTLPRHT